MKSHFQFSRKQRNGIFLLILLILGLQYVYFFFDFKTNEVNISQNQLEAYRSEVDSLRVVELEKSKPKIYPFNPNYITDYKGYSLGMSNQEIDRLLKFRESNQWVNSAKQFQNVTKVSDSLLDQISPYFKFPSWVTNPKPKSYNNSYTTSKEPKTFAQKQDLNTATSSQLQKVYGIGEKLSERIIDYRNKFQGGFVGDAELIQIWGLTPEVIENIKKDFTVKTPRTITRYNLNSATRDQLVTIPHIDYEIANRIIEERLLREGFKSIADLTKVEQFPVNKFDIIKLYLHLN